MTKKTTIILSTFNEQIAIEKTINEIKKHNENVEIVVVDDNSSDNTFNILKKLENDKTKIFLRKKSKGLASAFLLGLINSTGDIVGWVDSNMSSVVKLFPQMISDLKDNDVVILSRFVDNGKDERNFVRKWSKRIPISN